ncbi:hypothetical protein ILYODFUR_036714 [Ilyodon furcidens]|uniref:Uncharacterized protein n=1 Tax=Ilyodon furcidens TaxID=33524 RepID=A0ABV0U1X0_9TELE
MAHSKQDLQNNHKLKPVDGQILPVSAGMFMELVAKTHPKRHGRLHAEKPGHQFLHLLMDVQVTSITHLITYINRQLTAATYRGQETRRASQIFKNIPPLKLRKSSSSKF